MAMALNARILTKVQLPEEIEVEIEDTIRNTKVVKKIDFAAIVSELADAEAIDLRHMEPAEVISMASALAKHRAIDAYLLSIGIDPHKHLSPEERRELGMI